jgi:hypothetical protein
VRLDSEQVWHDS